MVCFYMRVDGGIILVSQGATTAWVETGLALRGEGRKKWQTHRVYQCGAG